MLFFDHFTEAQTAIAPGQQIGPGLTLVYDTASAMECTVRRSRRRDRLGADAPTLVIDGRARAPEDWFGIEIDLPRACNAVAITGRNYPVHRLFPRLHFEVLGKTEHLDLADVAASDSFATRYFDAREWREVPLFRDSGAESARLTVLVPSSPWFVMEIQDIRLDATGGTNDA